MFFWFITCSFTFSHAQQVQFDRYLSSPDTLVMPQLNFLLSAAIKWVVILNDERSCLVQGKISMHAMFRRKVKCLLHCMVFQQSEEHIQSYKNRTGALT